LAGDPRDAFAPGSIVHQALNDIAAVGDRDRNAFLTRLSAARLSITLPAIN